MGYHPSGNQEDQMSKRLSALDARKIVWGRLCDVAYGIEERGFGYETGAGDDAGLIRQHDEMLRRQASAIAYHIEGKYKEW